jgi:hypothetical protein
MRGVEGARCAPDEPAHVPRASAGTGWAIAFDGSSPNKRRFPLRACGLCNASATKALDALTHSLFAEISARRWGRGGIGMAHAGVFDRFCRR